MNKIDPSAPGLRPFNRSDPGKKPEKKWLEKTKKIFSKFFGIKTSKSPITPVKREAIPPYEGSAKLSPLGKQSWLDQVSRAIHQSIQQVRVLIGKKPPDIKPTVSVLSNPIKPPGFVSLPLRLTSNQTYLLDQWKNDLHNCQTNSSINLEKRISKLDTQMIEMDKILKGKEGYANFRDAATEYKLRFEKAKQALISLRGSQEAEEWANFIIRGHKIGSLHNHSHTQIPINLTPDKVEYYDILQKKIAEIIPEEYNRPTIEVAIKKEGAIIKNTTCILGGMGPMSDAAIVKKGVELINEKGRAGDPDPWDDTQIVILSSPAPLRGAKQLSNILMLKPWNSRIKEFMSRSETTYKGQNVRYFIASNTGHVHIRSKRGPLALGLYKDKIRNMPNTIATGIHNYFMQTPEKKGKVLILGTSEAAKKELYPTEFKKNQMDPDSFVTISDKDQNELQRIIDLTKQSRLQNMDLEKLKDIIARAKEENPGITHILLACTELPMALGEAKGYIKSLATGRNPIAVIDTEEIFAEQIASNVLNDKKNAEQDNAMFNWLTKNAPAGVQQ